MKLISKTQVCDMLGISKRTFDGVVRTADNFPEPVALTVAPRTQKWKLAEIEAWVKANLIVPECANVKPPALAAAESKTAA